MRLIDADDLDNVVLQLNKEGRAITRSEYKMLDNILFEFPTIEAEPVRRGHWILEDVLGKGWYRITCSECGEDVTSTAPCFGGVVTWDYCPWCGAKMEEQEWK